MTQNSHRLRAILDSLRVGVVAVDAEGKIELQNSEASRILGVSFRTTQGRKLEASLRPGHPALALLEQVLLHGREVTEHARPLPGHPGEDSLIVDLAATSIRDGEGVRGAVLTLRDHTIGRELETLVDQRARSELLSHLAAGFAHEVRNPLGGIRGSAELLLGKLDQPALARYAELIRDETDRILRLLDGLAEFTRGQDLHLRRLNLHRVLDDLLDLHRNETEWEGIEIVREYDPSIPEFELDPDRITQVFLNLVRNAAQAMGGRGRLRLRTRVQTQFQIAADDQPPAHMVRIDIDDSGPGIPEADLPHIFVPFFTRREQGTGLGLAIAQHWVVRHGGRIQASNRSEGGARIRVELPVRRGP